MSSLRETIIATVVTTLQAGSPPATVTRSNTFARNDADGSLPAMVVYPLKEKVQCIGSSLVQRNFSFAVECQVKDAPPIDQKLDALLNWAVQKLLADDTLGGLIFRCEETDIEWMIEVADEDIGAARITFEAIYATPRNDPTVQANG